MVFMGIFPTPMIGRVSTMPAMTLGKEVRVPFPKPAQVRSRRLWVLALKARGV
jgi:hypothetical protein